MQRLQEIFDRQAAYVESLADIEARNGLWVGPYPLRLNSRSDQEHFRLLAWRLFEEVTEAISAIEMRKPRLVVEEEVADAFHFLVELGLATGIRAGDVEDLFQKDKVVYPLAGTSVENKITAWMTFSASLGFHMQVLRQRPWRTDDRLTELNRWLKEYRTTFSQFLGTCGVCSISLDDLYVAYFSKSKINDERTRAQIK